MAASNFIEELKLLKSQLVKMGDDVLNMLKNGGLVIADLDEERARSIIKADNKVNEQENTVVNRAITLIATNQPVAGDLRFLASSLRLAIELERIGDLGSNIGRRALEIIQLRKEGIPTEPIPEDVHVMVKKALSMLELALSSLAENDPVKAEAVLAADDEVDEFNSRIRKNTLNLINQDGHKAAWGFEVITIASHIERLADHATNLAEETIYMAKGLNVRHLYPVKEFYRLSFSDRD
ncbi:MAG: phosphate signaling complex protein PhoU [Deltaproteobacteria bacterium]|jgi:phosphate transport system protein|nr:phosphate signaling complex protein PhoU [Deltaproteobacteria bacterium]